MRRIVTEAMHAGAVGLSTGLIYAPGMYASTDEIVTLAEEAARAGGIYASHIRGEGAHLFRAVDEAIEIGHRSSAPVHISHLKCESSHVWGRADQLLERVHSAGASGDQYPYAAWSSVLRSVLPPWAPVGELRRLMADVATKRRLVAAIEQGEGEEFQSSVDGVGWDRIVIEETSDRAFDGLDVATIAQRRGVEPVDACLDLLIVDPETTCTGHAMHEDDVRAIRADPEIMVASDAVSTAPSGRGTGTPVHPRTYGTFPRVLGPIVREGTLTLPAAVRAMTSLPADRFGLGGRGRISRGAWADLVLFDPATITDRATYEQPHAFPDGVEAVIVEGRIAWRRGSDTIERAGHVIHGGG
jgi:dihydroorotase/N-acyl-D-amino-acid deacylase